MVRGFFNKLASIWLVLCLSMSSVLFAEMKELGTLLHLSAYAGVNPDHADDDSHDHGDVAHHHAHADQAQPASHKHQHGPGEPEHEHTHYPVGALLSASFAFPAASQVQALLPCLVVTQVRAPASDKVPPSAILATSIRPPIA